MASGGEVRELRLGDEMRGDARTTSDARMSRRLRTKNVLRSSVSATSQPGLPDLLTQNTRFLGYTISYVWRTQVRGHSPSRSSVALRLACRPAFAASRTARKVLVQVMASTMTSALITEACAATDRLKESSRRCQQRLAHGHKGL